MDKLPDFKHLFETTRNTVRKYLDKRRASDCPVPNCPIDGQELPMPDPRCKCNDGFMIALRPGQHFHPCPIHPESVIVGRRTSWL